MMKNLLILTRGEFSVSEDGSFDPPNFLNSIKMYITKKNYDLP